MPHSRVAFTSVWAYSSAWLERFPDKEEVGGSSPPRPTEPSKDLSKNEFLDKVCQQAR